MDNKPYQHYKEQTVSTMTQAELLLLLYDELVKRLMRCDLALDQKNYPLLEDSVERSIAILNYLDDTLDRQYPIGNDLHRLYDFFCYELNRVKAARSKKELDKIRPMVAELRDSFRAAEKTGVEGL